MANTHQGLPTKQHAVTVTHALPVSNSPYAHSSSQGEHMQANSLPVGAATSALSAATPAASGTTAQPGTLHHAAIAPAAALLNMACTASMDLEEAGAESQPSPLKHMDSTVSQQVKGHHSCMFYESCVSCYVHILWGIVSNACVCVSLSDSPVICQSCLQIETSTGTTFVKDCSAQALFNIHPSLLLASSLADLQQLLISLHLSGFWQVCIPAGMASHKTSTANLCGIKSHCCCCKLLLIPMSGLNPGRYG